MRIRKINYYSVSHEESAVCSCCGKSIKNIVDVTTIEGEHFLFGSTCFDKRVKSNPKAYQIKEMNKIFKSIKQYCKSLERWETLTESEYEVEQYTGLPFAQWDKETEGLETFDKYKEFIVNELIPHRIEELEQKLKKYNKVEL